MGVFVGFIGGKRVGVCLRGVGSPRSIGGLSFTRLRILTTRVHRTLLGELSIRKNRFNPGVKFIRTAITLRCIFSSPGSGVIFSISRRYCPRGVLANEGSTCLSPTGCSSMAKCAGPLRDRRSVFGVNRASASMDLTYNLTGNESLYNNGRGVVTIVNSNSLDNNRTLRNLSFTNRRDDGVVVLIGSGSVSVTRGRNNVCGGLHVLHRDNNGYRYGLFHSVKLSCGFRTGKGSVRDLVGLFRSIGSVSRPIILRVMARGNGNCTPTIGGGRG